MARKSDEIVVMDIVWPYRYGGTKPLVTHARRVMRRCRSTTHTTPAGEVAIFGWIRHGGKAHFAAYEVGGIARVLGGDYMVRCHGVYSSDRLSSKL